MPAKRSTNLKLIVESLTAPTDKGALELTLTAHKIAHGAHKIAHKRAEINFKLMQRLDRFAKPKPHNFVRDIRKIKKSRPISQTTLHFHGQI
jgi:hypothetical protein